ncbi:copper amine oxidase N-terminal domain-containing protein [Paenibacillus sinopodophylli]|uniref:copper amine oxidase N-terminal domain-containing protein n=1 Tax=Paenibacillus sinopodophylli TaxID=1837342 RepID=UPI00110D24C9|nr:copper amine oxidase N-terminal domain-containing protein [Paenibacillus sinopodophylli]
MKMKKWLAPVLSLSLLLPALAGTQSVRAQSMKPTVETPAVELRAGLDYLLSEHFTLAVVSMTKAYDGATDAAAAQAALDQNAKDMVPAIASIYGDAGAKEFDRIFAAHNGYTDKYVKAVKTKDTMSQSAARSELEAFAKEFGSFLGAATEGNLPASAAQDAVRTHEEQVLEVFDSYAAGNYKAAYTEFREGLGFMFGVSDVLSDAITTQFPAKFNNTSSDTPAGDLRSALNHLAAEHYALAVLSMQKGFDKSPAYAALLEAQDGNTNDFTAAITSIYGADGGAAFKKVWTGDHIFAQDEIIKAVLAGDSAAISKARAKLDTFSSEFGKFLGTATGENLPTAGATAAVAEHEKLVLEAFDIYQSASKTGLYDSFRKGYSFMFGVGKALGGAIVTQKPELFQVAPPVTQPENPNAVTSIWFQIGNKNAQINGKNAMMDVAPYVKQGTTFVSLRTLTSTLGADVKYVPSNKTVELKLGTDKVVFWLGKNIIQVNGENVKLDAVVHIKEGRTQVPLRFIAEWLGWNVNFNKSNQSATLTKAM